MTGSYLASTSGEIEGASGVDFRIRETKIIASA